MSGKSDLCWARYRLHFSAKILNARRPGKRAFVSGVADSSERGAVMGRMIDLVVVEKRFRTGSKVLRFKKISEDNIKFMIKLMFYFYCWFDHSISFHVSCCPCNHEVVWCSWHPRVLVISWSVRSLHLPRISYREESEAGRRKQDSAAFSQLSWIDPWNIMKFPFIVDFPCYKPPLIVDFQLPCVTNPRLSLQIPDISWDLQVELHQTLAAVMSLVKLGKPNRIAFSAPGLGKSKQNASNRYSTWYLVPWLRLENHPEISLVRWFSQLSSSAFDRHFSALGWIKPGPKPGLFKIPEPPARFGANYLLNSKGSYFVLKKIKYLKIA